jgi:hypothetical protein
MARRRSSFETFNHEHRQPFLRFPVTGACLFSNIGSGNCASVSDWLPDRNPRGQRRWVVFPGPDMQGVERRAAGLFVE